MSDFYIQVDLDVMKLITPVSRSARLTPADTAFGLLQMWDLCWTKKVEVLDRAQIRGAFGSAEPEVISALISFGFLAVIEDQADTWRIRGAATRILRVGAAVTEARRKGGLAAKKNLKQYAEGKPTAKPAKKPKAAQAEPKTPKQRAPSAWELAWETMQDLADGYAEEHGVSYEREDIPPARVNAMLKKACEGLGVDADQLIEIWQEQWLPNEWAQGRDPVYALGAFLSSKTLPNYHRQWAQDALELAEYDRQVAAGETPRDPGFS